MHEPLLKQGLLAQGSRTAGEQNNFRIKAIVCFPWENLNTFFQQVTDKKAIITLIKQPYMTLVIYSTKAQTSLKLFLFKYMHINC